MKQKLIILALAVLFSGAALEGMRLEFYRRLTKEGLRFHDWQGGINIDRGERWLFAVPSTLSLTSSPQDPQKAIDELQSCRSIKRVSVVTGKESPDESFLKACGSLPSVREIQVFYSQLSDEALRSLLSGKIEGVCLWGIQVSPGLSRHLSTMPKLNELYLINCSCPADLISDLKACNELRLLHISDSTGFLPKEQSEVIKLLPARVTATVDFTRAYVSPNQEEGSLK